ncbi:MAG: ribonuclease P protein component [Candidatus Pacebacteria bacterium]|nr:ribonuclease P protein component [Candidatus Paceibacterota bacterium]
MLKKELRIRKQKDFENIYSKGVYCSEGFLAVKFIGNKELFSRFGFIVSKKISKKAVERNRIKRILRESIRLSKSQIKKGYDIILITRNGIESRTYREISNTVEKLLMKSGLLKK